MGIFGNSSPFDQDVEKATSENSAGEDWALILEICDRAGAGPAAARDCLRAVTRRLAHSDPHVQLKAATLLDACAANCGRAFLLEVASRDFLHELRRLLARAQPPVARRLRQLLRKWAEGEFRGDPQLDLVPSLYLKLRLEGHDFEAEPARAAPAAAPAAAERESDDLARAIELSLRESAPAAPAPAPAALYPRVEEAAAPAPAARKVRALYDFEAAEDNELTFLAGEIVWVTDASDPNWWKGSNERGEGLFPANFVSADLAPPAPKSEPRGGGGGKSVQFVAGGGGGGGGGSAAAPSAPRRARGLGVGPGGRRRLLLLRLLRLLGQHRQGLGPARRLHLRRDVPVRHVGAVGGDVRRRGAGGAVLQEDPGVRPARRPAARGRLPPAPRARAGARRLRRQGGVSERGQDAGGVGPQGGAHAGQRRGAARRPRLPRVRVLVLRRALRRRLQGVAAPAAPVGAALPGVAGGVAGARALEAGVQDHGLPADARQPGAVLRPRRGQVPLPRLPAAPVRRRALRHLRRNAAAVPERRHGDRHLRLRAGAVGAGRAVRARAPGRPCPGPGRPRAAPLLATVRARIKGGKYVGTLTPG